MKKTILFFVALVFFVMSCNTSGTWVKEPYDPNLPPEESSTLIFPKNIIVLTFDGSPADKETSSGWGTGAMKYASVLIPPGEHSLTCHVSNGNKYATDVPVKGVFEVGKKHIVVPHFNNENNTVRLTIEDFVEEKEE